MKREMKHVKKFGVILLLNKSEERSEKSCFVCSYRCLIAALIFSALLFLQFKEFELYWGAVFFFKMCSHIFMIFEVKLEW